MYVEKVRFTYLIVEYESGTHRHPPPLSLSLSSILSSTPPSLPPTLQLGSPFREPVMKFALKFPNQTVEYFLAHLSEGQISSIFHFFLEHKDGGPLRETLAASPDKIISFTFSVKVSQTAFPTLNLVTGMS